MRTSRAMQLGILLASTFACFAGASAQGDCAPPEELRQKIAAQPTTDDLNTFGVWFADHEKFNCAVEAFATSLEKNQEQKDFRHVIFMLGASLYYEGNTKEAAEALKEAERVGYRDKKLYLLLASALDAQHDVPTAEEEWKKALNFDPDSPTVIDALSTDMIAAGQYQDVAQLLQSRRLAPLRSEQAFQNLGLALVELGKFDDAAQVLEDGLNTYPDSIHIPRQLAAVLTRLHRDDEAAAITRLADEQHPATSTAP